MQHENPRRNYRPKLLPTRRWLAAPRPSTLQVASRSRGEGGVALRPIGLRSRWIFFEGVELVVERFLLKQRTILLTELNPLFGQPHKTMVSDPG